MAALSAVIAYLRYAAVPLAQAEERWTVPARARDLPGQLGETSVSLAPVLKAIGQDRDHVLRSPPLLDERGPRAKIDGRGNVIDALFRSWARARARSLRWVAGLRPPNLRSWSCQARALASSSRLAWNLGDLPIVAVQMANAPPARRCSIWRAWESWLASCASSWHHTGSSILSPSPVPEISAK